MEPNADCCLWTNTVATHPASSTLKDSVQVDVAIVGGGYTGLWSALWLHTLEPSLRIIVLEAKVCGHGASGRNGGWVMGSLEGLHYFAEGPEGALPNPVIEVLRDIVPSFSRILASAHLACDFRQGGAVYAAARYPQQQLRATAALAHYRQLGFDESDYAALTADDARQRVSATGIEGGIYTPHVAVVQPWKLVQALKRELLNRGVSIAEHTRVIGCRGNTLHTCVMHPPPPSASSNGRRQPKPHRLTTDRIPVRAHHVIWATEGYTDGRSPLHGKLLAVHSGMVATEPLSQAQWDTLGFHQHEAFSDFSRLSTYLQRTADNRLVVGARGHYPFSGRPADAKYARQNATQQRLALARSLFPSLKDVPFPFAWEGTLGIARQQRPHVIVYPNNQWLTAGGYAGEGVGASFLMARTMAELLTERITERTSMPWVHCNPIHQHLKSWEPTPLPWLAFNGIKRLFALEEFWDTRGAKHPAAWATRALATHTARLLDNMG